MAKKAAKKYTQHMREHKKGRRADMRWQFEDEANATMKKGRSTDNLARNKKPTIAAPKRLKKKPAKKKVAKKPTSKKVSNVKGRARATAYLEKATRAKVAPRK